MSTRVDFGFVLGSVAYGFVNERSLSEDSMESKAGSV
jgi:hypothetical protein